MKLTKTLLAALAVIGLSACDSDNEGENYYTYVYSFEQSDAASLYNADGYWTEVYNTDEDYTVIGLQPNVYFSHSASAEEWYGVVYRSWYGFCPSRANETYDVTTETDMTLHQWSSVTGNGVGSSSDYLLGYWNCTEETTSIPENPSMKITFNGGAEPLSVYVTNSNYAYWVMKNGNSFSQAFDSSSWFKVSFIGVKNEAVTNTVDFYLAKDGEIVNSWKGVDLSPLGNVDYVYIQMSSSDTGEYGMNTPGYVCLDNLAVRYTY